MTKLFDFIHHYGCKETDRRACKKDPEYAARYAARRIKPGIVLGSEGPGGLDGFFADLNYKNDKYRPWWHTVSLHIHWWMQKYGIRPTYYSFIAFWQRGKRGWSDRDTWSLDTYLATTIRDSVQHMNSVKHGWPGQPMAYEQWGQILNEISNGMQAHLDIMDILKKDKDQEKLQAQVDLAFDHLKKHFGSLWD